MDIFAATINGDLNRVKFLVNNGVNVNQLHGKHTLIEYSIMNDKSDITKFLLSKNVDAQHGMAAAIIKDDIELIQSLLRHHAKWTDLEYVAINHYKAFNIIRRWPIPFAKAAALNLKWAVSILYSIADEINDDELMIILKLDSSIIFQNTNATIIILADHFNYCIKNKYYSATVKLATMLRYKIQNINIFKTILDTHNIPFIKSIAQYCHPGRFFDQVFLPRYISIGYKILINCYVEENRNIINKIAITNNNFELVKRLKELGTKFTWDDLHKQPIVYWERRDFIIKCVKWFKIEVDVTKYWQHHNLYKRPCEFKNFFNDKWTPKQLNTILNNLKLDFRHKFLLFLIEEVNYSINQLQVPRLHHVEDGNLIKLLEAGMLWDVYIDNKKVLPYCIHNKVATAKVIKKLKTIKPTQHKYLINAIATTNRPLVAHLLKIGCPVNIKNNKNTPLLIAIKQCRRGNYALLDEVLKYEPDLEINRSQWEKIIKKNLPLQKHMKQYIEKRFHSKYPLYLVHKYGEAPIVAAIIGIDNTLRKLGRKFPQLKSLIFAYW